MLSNTLWVKFSYLTIIHILHPRFHPKIKGHILRNKQNSKCVFIHEIAQLIIMKRKMEMKKYHKDTTKIDLGLDMDTNIVNKNSVSV